MRLDRRSEFVTEQPRPNPTWKSKWWPWHCGSVQINLEVETIVLELPIKDKGMEEQYANVRVRTSRIGVVIVVRKIYV